MEDKLQLLIDTIRQEGVGRAQAMADNILEEAEKEAAQIRQGAAKEAEALIQEARLEAERLRENTAAELQLAARQAKATLQEDIASLLATAAFSSPLQQVFNDKAFLQELIQRLAERWQESGGAALQVSPEAEPELWSFFSQKAKAQLQEGISLSPIPGLKPGFRIGPDGEQYVITFSEADFHAFFTHFLRPHTKALLFGE
ncbi:V-type ATP synthase subunit E [Phaeodactylibacter luteus]|uniref:V-type ATP synthase subunit E n=1 Tax=Phaeodactylibacter luteus TaxID=1564516 RepID=A0A5C6RKE7_9BACT|nr:V-type ATP synthase subunit E [Phaeodactylibacter luteus]TXB62871.1 V-type ATP synthase subunit E [Phaeodactylibacter luteus]